MSFLTLARVLFAFLAFQLAVGLQPTIANAAAPQSATPSAVACPTHSAMGGAQAAALTHDQPAHDPSPLQHNCCKSPGCQGHCGTLPLAIDLSAPRGVPDDRNLLRPTPTTRAPSALPDTHFRPPIAA